MVSNTGLWFVILVILPIVVFIALPFIAKRKPQWTEHLGDLFLTVVAVTILILFGWSIYLAGTAPSNAALPGIVTFFATSVNGVLAANLGALIGIHVLWNVNVAPSYGETLQLGAAIWYVIMLAIAVYFWSLKGFSENDEQVAILLPTLGKHFVGIVVGVLGAVLGVKGVRRLRE